MRLINNPCLSIIVGLILLAINSAKILAAEPPINLGTIPSVTDAGLAQKRLSLPQNPLQFTNSNIKLPDQKQAQENTSVQAAKIQFVLKQINLVGNTQLPAQELQVLYAPLINQKISLLQLQQLVDEITNSYRNRGYILTRAILPPQTIKDGTVTIQVIEGHIENYSVQGKPGKAKKLLEQYGQQIASSNITQANDLERYMLLANDIPGADVKAILVPSPNAPAAADLIMASQLKKADAYISYDNYGTRYLGPQQFTVGGNLNSWLTPGDSTSARITATQETEQLNFLEITHSTPVGDNGLRWWIGGNYARTNPGFLLTPLDLVSKNTMFYTNLSYPVVRSRRFNWFVQGGLNYLNSDTSALSEQLYNDRIRYASLSTYLNGVDNLRGVNNANLEIDQGLDVLNASDGTDVSRLGAKPNFTKLFAQISRLQFLGSRYSFLLAGQGQYAFSSLLTAEQFSFGGPDFGRGYDPAEIVGDRGIAGKAELRMDTWPEWHCLNTVQYYTFFDAGKVWNINSLIQYADASGTSAGVGARFNFDKYFSGNLYVAKPLSRPAANEVAAGEDGKGLRAFFQLTMNF